MTLSDFSIKRPVFASVISLVIVLLGLFMLPKLTLRELPAFDLPTVTVQTIYPGASVDLVERQVTGKIERAVAGVGGIDLLTSTSVANASIVEVKFKMGVDPAAVEGQVRAKVEAIIGELPAAVQRPEISRVSTQSQPVVYLTLSGESAGPGAVTQAVDQTALPMLATVPGIANTQVYGKQPYALRIWVDPQRAAGQDVAITDVVNAVRNEDVELPAGAIESGGIQRKVMADTRVRDLSGFDDIVLKHGKDGMVRLGQLAQVEVGLEDSNSATRFNGDAAVTLGLVPQGDADPIALAEAAREMLPDIKEGLPDGVDIQVAFDSTIFIEESIHEVIETGLITLALVMAVVIFFMGSLRTVGIAAITIPVSIIGTIGAMGVLGFSINTFTLLAIVLAIGLVVDDAIVVIENVERHTHAGLRPYDAALVGSREIVFAVIAMTTTLAAVYAPIGMAPGMLGVLFREFAFTLAAAVIISGIAALTLTPMMCSRMLSAERHTNALTRFTDKLFGAMERGCAVMVRAAVNHPVVTLLVGIGVAFAGFYTASTLPSEFIPAEDKGYLTVDFTAPATASMGYMQTHARGLEEAMAELPEHKDSLVIIGGGRSNTGTALMLLKPWEERERSAMELAGPLSEPTGDVTGFETSVLVPNPLAGDDGKPMVMYLQSTRSYQELAQLAETVTDTLRESESLTDVSDQLRFDSPGLKLQIDRDAAAELGVSMRNIGTALAVGLQGQNAALYESEGRSYEVVVKLAEQYRHNLDNVLNLSVRSADGDLVPIRAFAEVVPGVQAEALTRVNQQRTATIAANVAPDASIGEAVAEVETLLAGILPEDVTLEFGGQARSFVTGSGAAGTVFLMALIAIYLVLCAQFESFRDPIIVLLVVPMAMSGAFFGLAAIGGTSNAYSTIGLVTLVGLIAKHGILITEFANQQRAEGQPKLQAIQNATVLRLRPILMTTLAMVLGVVPLLIADGPGSVSRNQIGAVLCGGLTVGTIFSLFVVPAVYVLISRRDGEREQQQADPLAGSSAGGAVAGG